MNWGNYGLVSAEGAIEAVYFLGAEAAAMQSVPDGMRFMEIPAGASGETHYVQDNEVLPKQPSPLYLDKPQIAADGNDTATVSNVPPGTTLIWHDGQEDVVNDGQVQLSTDLPGTYTLVFDAVPYLRQEVAIEAVAAT